MIWSCLDIDFMAYQDEIGVRKTKLSESEGFYAALKRVHDKAGRASFGRTSRCLNLKARYTNPRCCRPPFERVQKQLEAVSPYVEEI